MENPKNNKKTVGTIVGLAVGLIVYFLVKQFVFAPPSFDKVMMQAVSKINESCPIMVDQDTRLDNAIALPENILQYNYTLVNWVKDSVDLNAFEDYMQPMILKNVKTNPDLKIYRDNKTTMAYNYKDMNGLFITKISITADQYSDSE
ncbi:MAG: hypothetical protein ACK5HT_18570 [Draconibacterium sp.]